jgi:hypothetical protein
VADHRFLDGIADQVAALERERGLQVGALHRRKGETAHDDFASLEHRRGGAAIQPHRLDELPNGRAGARRLAWSENAGPPLAPLDADQGPARFAEEGAETARECLGAAHGRDSDQATTERTPVTLRTRPFRRQPM